MNRRIKAPRLIKQSMPYFLLTKNTKWNSIYFLLAFYLSNAQLNHDSTKVKGGSRGVWEKRGTGVPGVYLLNSCPNFAQNWQTFPTNGVFLPLPATPLFTLLSQHICMHLTTMILCCEVGFASLTVLKM